MSISGVSRPPAQPVVPSPPPQGRVAAPDRDTDAAVAAAAVAQHISAAVAAAAQRLDISV